MFINQDKRRDVLTISVKLMKFYKTLRLLNLLFLIIIMKYRCLCIYLIQDNKQIEVSCLGLPRYTYVYIKWILQIISMYQYCYTSISSSFYCLRNFMSEMSWLQATKITFERITNLLLLTLLAQLFAQYYTLATSRQLT